MSSVLGGGFGIGDGAGGATTRLGCAGAAPGVGAAGDAIGVGLAVIGVVLVAGGTSGFVMDADGGIEPLTAFGGEPAVGGAAADGDAETAGAGPLVAAWAGGCAGCG